MFIFAIISSAYYTIYCVLCLCSFAFLLELDINKYVFGTSSTFEYNKSKLSTPTKYATSLAKRLMGSSWRVNTRKSSTHLPPTFPWLTPETLDSHSVLILFSNTRNKQKTSSTSYIRLKHVTNCWAVVHKSWMERSSLRAPEF